MHSKSTRSRPGRPVRQARQARSRNTVDAIVEATARILARDGWAAVNTNAIAAVAGVSIGSVYEYFENKEAILDVIISRHLATGEARLAAFGHVAPGALSPRQIVEHLVAGFIGIHSDDPRLHRALSGEVPLSTAQRARINTIRDRAIKLLSGLLAANFENADIKATMMIDAADALTHRWFVDDLGVPVEPEVLRRELEQMLTSYLMQKG